MTRKKHKCKTQKRHHFFQLDKLSPAPLPYPVMPGFRQYLCMGLFPAKDGPVFLFPIRTSCRDSTVSLSMLSLFFMTSVTALQVCYPSFLSCPLPTIHIAFVHNHSVLITLSSFTPYQSTKTTVLDKGIGRSRFNQIATK
ncbi:hypothetical protein VTN00DRAFT_1050 [Thermoascus crustaceus]|uniref:uncharacterized protein n=1 Tax=Thermoascus crustaceus TaxID=5088 RepID=UPI0037444A4E